MGTGGSGQEQESRGREYEVGVGSKSSMSGGAGGSGGSSRFLLTVSWNCQSKDTVFFLPRSQSSRFAKLPSVLQGRGIPKKDRSCTGFTIISTTYVSTSTNFHLHM